MTKANHESLLDICRRHGLRITGQRRVILEVLDASGDHPDVEELHRRVAAIEPGINIATVYRTMNKLAEKGLIERHMFEDGRLRYEPAPEQHQD
ncbi:transcriptional repressor, partial [Rhodovulum sulfidophilum]|nr:transcriptional repressor [Rhodovulum sulfidophilum]